MIITGQDVLALLDERYPDTQPREVLTLEQQAICVGERRIIEEIRRELQGDKTTKQK